MYETHFGLSRPPFRITPDTRCFYAGARRGALLDALVYAIERGEGLVKLTGEVGSGKTMLCRMLAERLAERAEVVYLANPSLGSDEVLAAIALELGLPAEGGRLALLQTLQGHLLRRHAEGRPVVVFIEEAQAMDGAALESVRLLSNLETREAKLLQLVLFGQPELDDLLAVHELRQLRERITQSFHLEPLSPAEIGDYVQFRLRAAGYRGADPFTPGALRLLARASRGLVRRIHILADKALLAAYIEGRRQVTARHLRRAIADSELPGPGMQALFARLPRPAWGWGAALAAGLAALLLLPLHGPVPDFSAPALPSVSELAAIAPAAGTPASATPVSAEDLLQRLLAESRRAAGDGSGYAIQLLTTDSADPAPLRRLLDSTDMAPLRERLLIAPTRVGGELRWSVLLGRFDSVAEARAALAALPERLARNHPYLRSLEAVRREFERHALATDTGTAS